MGVLKKHGLFCDLQFVLDLGSLSFKKKKKVREDITSNGGYVSYILTKKSDFVLVSCEKGSKVDTYKTRKAEQLKVPVVTRSYIEDCLSNNEILDTDEYKVAGETKKDFFSKGKIQIPEWQTGEKENSELKHLSTEEVQKLVPTQYISDSKTCPKFGGNFQVGKFAVLMDPGKNKNKYRICTLELHLPFRNEEKVDQEKIGRFRIMEQTGVMEADETMTDKTSFEYFFNSCNEALMVMQYFVDKHKNKDKMQSVLSLPYHQQIGSTKLKQILDSMGSCYGKPNPEVLLLVGAIFKAVFDKFEDTDMDDISVDQINKGLVILMKIRDALKNQQPTDTLTEEYYRTIGCDESETPINDKKTLSNKFDFVQVLQDFKIFAEAASLKDSARYWSNSDSDSSYSADTSYSSSSSGSSSSADSDTDSFDSFGSDVVGATESRLMQQGMRCSITWLPPDDSEYISVAKLMGLESSGTESANGLKVVNIFGLYRDIEFTDFTHSIPNKKLLLHASKPENFFGILSRGMLPPLVVVGEHGVDRTDCGLLGTGIYFSDDVKTTVQYSKPNDFKGTRFILVNEVCLGNCYDFNQQQPDLTCPPEGYDSVRGVGRDEDSTSMFEANEYVIYNKNQQRLRYLVEFVLDEEKVQPCKIAHIRQISDQPDLKKKKPSKVSVDDIENKSNPNDKVEPGLIVKETGKDKQVPLQQVHIRGSIIDMVAKVVVFQSYVNESNKPLEAKYVFPLSGSAAVCGFEAFINDKHVVGKVKEKEAAHREYKQAISQGHGAYLMDEEQPEVFTVSVGNLPPSARVVIKITYVTELPVMIKHEDLTDFIEFHLPSSLAPSVKNNVLVSGPITQTQMDRVTADSGKLCNFSLMVSVEMPFDIKRLECPTNKIKYKITRSKATVCLVNKESLSKDGFRLLIGLAEIHVPRMWSERHPDLCSQASMLAFYPEFEAAPVLAYKAIIVIDISNSITTGGSEKSLKKVALLILKNLSIKCHINIIKFASHYEELFVKEQPLCENSVRSKAEDFIMLCEARYGSSDAWRPLAHFDAVKKFSEENSLTNIFLLSDGHLDEKSKTLQVARSLAGDSTQGNTTRIFTFSFGSSADQYFMKSIATASNGFHEHFSSKLKSKWIPKVESQLNKASQPVLTDIHIKWEKYADKDDSTQSEDLTLPIQAPEHISTLYNSSRLVVYGMVPHCTTAQLFAKVCGKEISTVVSTSALSITTGKTIHQLATRAMINDYEEGMHEVDPLKRDDLKKLRRPHIVELSIQHSIVSQYTSFVAVEEREEDEKLVTGKGPSIQNLVLESETDQLPNLPWIGEEVEEDTVTLQKVYGKLHAAEVTYYSSLAQAQRMFAEVDEMIPDLTKKERTKASFIALTTRMKLGMEVSLADIDSQSFVALITEALRENDEEVANALSTVFDFPGRYGLRSDKDSNRKVLEFTKSGIEAIDQSNIPVEEGLQIFKEKLATHQGNDILKVVDLFLESSHQMEYLSDGEFAMIPEPINPERLRVMSFNTFSQAANADKMSLNFGAQYGSSGAVGAMMLSESESEGFSLESVDRSETGIPSDQLGDVVELCSDVVLPPKMSYKIGPNIEQALFADCLDDSLRLMMAENPCYTMGTSTVIKPQKVEIEESDIICALGDDDLFMSQQSAGKKMAQKGSVTRDQKATSRDRSYPGEAWCMAPRTLSKKNSHEEWTDCMFEEDETFSSDDFGLSDEAESLEPPKPLPNTTDASRSSKASALLKGIEFAPAPPPPPPSLNAKSMSLETVTKTPPPLPERFKACMLSPQTKKQAACLPPRLVPQSNLLARKHDALRVGGGDLNKAAAMRSSFQATRFDSFSMQMPANTGDATELSKETIEPLCDEDESFSSHDSNFSNEAETLEPPKSPPKTLPKTADPPRSFKTDKRRAGSETIKSYQKLKSVQTFCTQALSRDLPPAPPRSHPSLSANRKSLETVTKTETALQAHYSAKTKNRASLRSAQSGPQSNLFARNRDALPGGLRVRVGGGKTIARRSSHHATRLDSLSMQMPDNTDDDADIIKTYLSLYEEKEKELADVLCLKRIRPASKPQTIESVLQKERLYEAINNYIEKESSFPWAHAPLLNVVLKKNEALLKILKEAGASSLGPNVFNALYEMVRVAVIAKVLKELNCKNDDVKDKQRQKIVSTQMTWLKKMDSIYPSLYSRLELGKDWEDAANNILQTLLAGLKPEKAINDLFFSFE